MHASKLSRRNPIAGLLPSPAMIVACMALVVALGGVSYAAVVLPANSVGTTQVKKSAITGAKIGKNAVTGAKVKNGTLMAGDFMAGQLPAGPQGPKGDMGIQGAPGLPGPAGVSGWQRVLSQPVAVGPGLINGSTATCPAGKKVLGGGFITSGSAFEVTYSAAYSDTSWRIEGKNVGITSFEVFAQVICANVG